jgi:2'-5' RNA ligase
MQSILGFVEDASSAPKRPVRADRLFFGVLLDSETAILVAQFTERFLRQNHLKGTPLRADRYHISLHPLGDHKLLPARRVYAASRAAEAVAMSSREVTFRSIGSFEGAPAAGGRPRRCPLVLLGEGGALSDLHKTLGAAMKKNGLKAVEHFTPHITLFYGPGLGCEQPIEPIRFIVREFVLIHSKLGLSQYNIIGRWPLRSCLAVKLEKC